MLYVGTAGFSYSDWSPMFYPQGMRSKEFLEYYSRRFACVEIDFTYYRQPSPKTMAAMASKVPSEFRFAVKAHRTITHEIPGSYEGRRAEIATFREGVLPMVESGNLGCILYQFPWGFKYSLQNLSYLVSLKEAADLGEAVVEFRNVSWAREDVYRTLRDSGIGFCAVDEPALKGLFPPVTLVTSDLGYVRFHGRNAAKWWNHKEAWERYDYLYSDDELRSWLPKISNIEQEAGDVYVLFNNCHRGQAAANALRMKELLGQAELPFGVQDTARSDPTRK